MHPVEPLISLHLAQKLGWFISPQFEVRWDEDAGDGGSDPDFVCLDFANRMVRVVEISTGADLNKQGWKRKIDERQTRWFTPILRKLKADGVIDDGWSVSLVAFIRNDRLAWFEKAFPTDAYADVEARSLEDAVIAWR